MRRCARWVPIALVIAIVMALASINGAQAAVIYVKAGATGTGNGQTWANAYADLQAALAAAQWGDEIWVAAGTYKPTSGADRTKSFVMTAGVEIYGGFTGSETTRDARDWKAHETILSGDLGKQGGSSYLFSYHVVAGGYNSTLDGFTVTKGYASGSAGGGMVNDSVSLHIVNCTFSKNSGGMYNSNSSPTVTNCTFSSNTAGGGMHNTHSSPTITNCTFNSNMANNGGGIFTESNSSPTVTNCDFSGNTANNGGGGMYNINSTPTVTNCTFSSNTAGYAGGGIFSTGSLSTLTNCVFIGNLANGAGGGGFYGAGVITNCTFNSNTAKGASGNGGGIESGQSTVINCTFKDNKAVGNGGGIYGVGVSGDGVATNCTFNGNTAGNGGGMYTNDYTVTNCILWGNKATIGPEVFTDGIPAFIHCDIMGSGGSGAQWNPALGIDGGGNIMVNPAFIDSLHPAGPDDLWRTADDGLALAAGSPCIDAGTNSNAPTSDTLGNHRPADGNGDGQAVCDIGAYEFQSPDPTPTPTPTPTPRPPTAPGGGLALTYRVQTPSTSPDGLVVQYTYHWTSDKGDDLTHGPTTDTTDILTEMNQVQAGELWTVTVTPRCGTVEGPPATAKVRIYDPRAGVWVWSFYP